MSFKMIYDERNRNNLDKLADNTKIAAYKWYQYCIDNEIQVLIYETIRTVEQQRKNVANGASQTMKSYHLVGQALDFVPVDSKGKTLWNGYNHSNIQKALNYARKIGFELGYDWGWDSPHLQYNYKGYGTDTFGKVKMEKKESVRMFKPSSPALRDNYKIMLSDAVKKEIINESWLKKYNDDQLTLDDAIALVVTIHNRK